MLQLLKEQEKTISEWRKIRDETTESFGEDQIADWRYRLEAVKPKDYMAFELAFAFRQIDPDTAGIKLLSHKLAKVREGAFRGLGRVGSPALVEKLYKERKQSATPPGLNMRVTGP